MRFLPIRREQGHFQCSLSRAEMIKICSCAFPELRVKEIMEMDMGFFNNTYRITFHDASKAILRVAPHHSELLYSHESHLMRGEYTINPFFSVISEYIPRTLFADFSGKLISRDYVFQSFIDGVIWGTVQDAMQVEENECIWKQLGAITKRINSVTHNYFGTAYPFPGFKTWSQYFIDLLEKRLHDMYRFGLFDSELLAFKDLVNECKPWLDEVSVANMCHGDLWPNNILIRKTERGLKIVGILDIERAYWGDPLAEWTFSTFDYPPAFWKAYGKPKKGFGQEIRMLIYKGNSLAISILESVRFKYEPPYAELNMVNINLRHLIDSYYSDDKN